MTKILTDEQKDRFVSEICQYGTGFVAPLHSVVESIEQAVLQSPEVAAMRKDAERLRHCLQHGFPQEWEEMKRGAIRTYWTQRPGAQEEYRTAVDAIDTAIQEQKP